MDRICTNLQILTQPNIEGNEPKSLPNPKIDPERELFDSRQSLKCQMTLAGRSKN